MAFSTNSKEGKEGIAKAHIEVWKTKGSIYNEAKSLLK